MPPHLTGVLLLLALLCACGNTRAVRLDMGQGQPVIHLPLGVATCQSGISG